MPRKSKYPDLDGRTVRRQERDTRVLSALENELRRLELHSAEMLGLPKRK